MLVLLCVLDKRSRKAGIICDKSAIIPAFPEEGTQGLNGVRDQPVVDHRGVFWGNANSPGAHLVSQVLDAILEQLGLLRGYLKAGGAE